jgi:hypothetical protein
MPNLGGIEACALIRRPSGRPWRRRGPDRCPQEAQSVRLRPGRNAAGGDQVEALRPVNARYLWETGARTKTQGETLVVTATFPIPSVKLK